MQCGVWLHTSGSSWVLPRAASARVQPGVRVNSLTRELLGAASVASCVFQSWLVGTGACFGAQSLVCARSGRLSRRR